MKKLNRRSLIKSSLAATGSVALGGFAAASAPLYRYDRSVGVNRVRSWEKSLAVPPAVPLKARLLANENPYGPSPKARLALMENAKLGNRYGFNEAGELIKILAEIEGVSEDHIALGSGSTSLLENTAIINFHGGGSVVTADPSYLALIRTSLYFDAEVRSVPLTDSYAHDLVAMENAIDDTTKLVYVCNPNNPTGSMTPAQELHDFCKRVSNRATVFADEAYMEFLPEDQQHSLVKLVQQGHDVIVSRTFSKIYGMAGMRMGYIVGPPETIREINRLSSTTMGLSIISLKAALACVGDQDFLQMSRQKNTEARDYVCQTLKSMGKKYIPSSTSFVIFPLAQDGEKFLSSMFERGVGVRLFEIDDAPWCRVSMGTMVEMEMFAGALKEVLV